MAGIQNGRKIPLGIVWQAVIFPLENFMALVRVGLPVTLISAAILYAASLTVPLIGSQLPFHILKFLLYLCLASVIAVGIHRLILRGEQPEWTVPRLRNYELAYGATGLIFAAITLAEQGVIQYLLANPAARELIQSLDRVIGWIWPQLYVRLLLSGVSPGLIAIIIVLIGATIWPSVRLALVFPHAAITGRVSFGESWAAMRGNFWRMIGVGALLAITVYLLLMVFVFVMAMLIAALKGALGAFIFSLLYLLLFGLQFSMFVALMSYIYMALIQGAEPIVPLRGDFPPPLRPELGT